MGAFDLRNEEDRGEAEVSVIMPMRNAREHVAAALGSLLVETGVRLEIVVVDDGSEDGAGEIVRGMNDGRIVIVAGGGRGISDAFNQGLAAASGSILMRCDADDVYPAGRIREQAAFLREHPDFGAVCGRFGVIDGKGQVVGELNQGQVGEEITRELKDGRTRTHFCTFAVRAECLRAVGGCRRWFVTAEDIDLQLRLGGICQVWYDAEVRYWYRVHDGSITHRQPRGERVFYEAAARRFATQRAAFGADDLERGCAVGPAEDGGGQGGGVELPGVPGFPGVPGGAGEQLQAILMGMAWRAKGRGRWREAVRLHWRACMARPVDGKVWRSLAELIVKF